MNTSSTSSEISILLVDDEPNILMALEFLLQREGYRIEKALSSAQALDLLTDFHPDIAVLDVMMPGMDGFELAHRIRLSPGLEKTRIVFLTAKGTSDDRMRGYDSGGEYYLVKPFDNDEFVRVIHELREFSLF